VTSPNSGTTDPSQPPQAPTPPARASDADREAVVRTLHDAVARGLLNLDEGDERVAAAYAARFVDDLPRLTADLPPAPVPAPVAPGWRALAVLALLQLRTALAGISWRAVVGSRRRLAVAAVVVLAVLSLGGIAARESFDHGGDFGHEVEHVDND
jgi:hypothetical protein